MSAKDEEILAIYKSVVAAGNNMSLEDFSRLHVIVESSVSRGWRAKLKIKNYALRWVILSPWDNKVRIVIVHSAAPTSCGSTLRSSEYWSVYNVADQYDHDVHHVEGDGLRATFSRIISETFEPPARRKLSKNPSTRVMQYILRAFGKVLSTIACISIPTAPLIFMILVDLQLPGGCRINAAIASVLLVIWGFLNFATISMKFPHFVAYVSQKLRFCAEYDIEEEELREEKELSELERELEDLEASAKEEVSHANVSAIS